MSTLQVANIWFESTANNRFQYAGSNTINIVAGSSTTLTVNSTAVIANSLAVSNTITVTGAATFSNTLSDSIGNIRNVPVNSQTSGAYTLVASDNGKFIDITGGGIVVPASIFSAGQSVTIYNDSSANQSIVQTSGVTMYLVGSSTTGNRTLAQRGLATVFCVGANTFVITGGGLT